MSGGGDMPARRRIEEADLHAWVDGQLDAERALAVEAWIAADPEAASRVAVWQKQKRTLAALFDPVADEPIPERLSSIALAATARRHRADAWRWRIAAGIGGLAVGAALATAAIRYVGDGPAVADAASLSRQAAQAHRVFVVERRHPVEVAANEEAHLVQWLTRRLGVKVSAPDLTGLGWTLVGGRLLPGDSGPAAQLMYEDRGGRRATVYMAVNETSRETAFLYGQQGSIRSFHWIDGKVGYALSAEIDRGELTTLARAVHERLRR